ncbi:MAG: helix-turn-helix domain-containing protein [Planctomycetes bacterium]|nr:helix-turn-helix domain-containing protein [Planctomycetota bacterium]
MNLHFDPDDLRPIVEAVVAEVLDQVQADTAKLGDRLAFPEAEAAAIMGIPRHSLRDARLRGEIEASKIGKRIIYSRETLVAFLQRMRTGG